MINEILTSNWFWSLWSVLGAYAMMKIHKKGLPFFGDFATFWFGITAFLIGFTVQFSFLDILLSSSKSLDIREILYLAFLIIMFITTLRTAFKFKWLKPFAFIINMFILGMLSHSIYQKVFA